jgi:HD superfamily phosphohydrolase
MPDWGLTKEMRDAGPWGLPAGVLAPGKVITDAVHGDVYVTLLEQAIVDSPAFQRLRRVRQLGTTHLVYPGATHTRFAHSLGALRVVQDLLDVALAQRDTRHGVPDLFEQWRDELGIPRLAAESAGPTNTSLAKAIRAYNQRVAEAIIVARLGALLHDIGHVAYGHSVEDDLEILTPHDKNNWRFDRLWETIAPRVVVCADGSRYALRDLFVPKLMRELRPLILSKAYSADHQKRLKYPFVQDLVGNTICADLIDYLQRDHLYTGLPLSLGHRYMSGFYVTPDGPNRLFPRRMALNIHRSGKERADIVSELLKHLRYRYELQERVIVHHAKLAADAMVGKMLELLRDALWTESATALLDPPDVGSRHDHPPEAAEDEAALREAVDDAVPGAAKRIDAWVARRLEELFLSVSDDGLFEHLRRNNAFASGVGRRGAVATIASDLLDRRLFKPAASVRGAKAADELYAKFHSPDARRRLERDAAGFAELTDGWKVVIWLPKPEMRLKQAEVLVDHGDGISKLRDYSDRGREIYEDHKRLWRVSVFVDSEVTAEEKAWVLARLSQTMLVHWEGFEHWLGSEPEQAPEHLAALLACNQDRTEDDVAALLAFASERPLRGTLPTATLLAEHYRQLRDERLKQRRNR